MYIRSASSPSTVLWAFRQYSHLVWFGIYFPVYSQLLCLNNCINSAVYNVFGINDAACVNDLRCFVELHNVEELVERRYLKVCWQIIQFWYFYWQHCAKRKAPVFNLLRGRFWDFSPRMGDTLHRWGKFGKEEGAFGPLLHAKFHPDRCSGNGIGPQNEIFTEIWSKCEI